MKLNNLGIRLNIACVGTGSTFVNKFQNYSYWLDGDKLIQGNRVMVLEIWINNRRVIRCFQNSHSKLLFCEINSWPNEKKKQIVMADFCEEGLTLPVGSVKDVYTFLMDLFKRQSSQYAKPGRILNVIRKIQTYESLDLNRGIDQFQ